MKDTTNLENILTNFFDVINNKLLGRTEHFTTCNSICYLNT